MRQIGLGLLGRCNSDNVFPLAGTFFDDPDVHQGDPTRSAIFEAVVNPASLANNPGRFRSNWVVAISPFLDIQGLFNEWSFDQAYMSMTGHGADQISNAKLASISIGILRCPEDPSAEPNRGNLSYAVNAGFSRWQAIPVGWDGIKQGNSGVMQWTKAGSPWKDTQAVCKKLGVMSLGTTTGKEPWDVRTSPSDITDGASATLLVGERTTVGYSPGTPYSGGLPTNWACPLPNFCTFMASDDVCQTANSSTDCLGGQLRRTPAGLTGPGWSLANRAGQGEGINGGKADAVEGSYPFANSGHAGGSNFVFCDGAVRYLTKTIDGGVYASIITPAGSKLPDEIKQSPVSQDSLSEQ